MKTFTLSAGSAPAANVFRVSFGPPFWMLVPGASWTKSRKLRSERGRRSTCCRVTLVATSDVRVSTPDAATILTASIWIADAASLKSSGYTSPINTRAWILWGAIPICRAVTSYSPGVSPRIV